MDADLISLDVIEAIAIGQVLCNSALAASCGSSDNENVVMACDGHGGRVGGFERSRRNRRRSGRYWRCQRRYVLNRGRLFDGLQHDC
jgi:hypothetical protein